MKLNKNPAEDGSFSSPGLIDRRGKKRRWVMAQKGNIEKKIYMASALLTVAEAARYLGVSRKKVYQLIEWGEFSTVKLGRSLQIEKKSLDEFRASGKLF